MCIKDSFGSLAAAAAYVFFFTFLSFLPLFSSTVEIDQKHRAGAGVFLPMGVKNIDENAWESCIFRKSSKSDLTVIQELFKVVQKFSNNCPKVI